jgi:hypothetical protein
MPRSSGGKVKVEVVQHLLRDQSPRLGCAARRATLRTMPGWIRAHSIASGALGRTSPIRRRASLMDAATEACGRRPHAAVFADSCRSEGSMPLEANAGYRPGRCQRAPSFASLRRRMGSQLIFARVNFKIVACVNILLRQRPLQNVRPAAHSPYWARARTRRMGEFDLDSPSSAPG